MNDDDRALVSLLKAVEKKASDGRWFRSGWTIGAKHLGETATTIGHTGLNKRSRTQQNADNAEFIAVARNSMPMLLGLVGRLNAEVERLRLKAIEPTAP